MADISRFTDRARGVLSLADSAAAARGLDKITCPCLMLALTEYDCVAGMALENLRVRDKLRTLAVSYAGPVTKDPPYERVRRFAEDVDAVLGAAVELGKERGRLVAASGFPPTERSYCVSTEEILLATMAEWPSWSEGIVLRSQVESEIERLLNRPFTLIEESDKAQIVAHVIRFFTRDGTGACTRSIWVRYDWRDGGWEMRVYRDRCLRDAYDLGKPDEAIPADVADLVIKALEKLRTMKDPKRESDA